MMRATKNSMDAIITVSGLTKTYKDLVAVNSLSLSIEPGEIYGFVGLNGAGKTTTIRMLLGMIKPSAGKVFLFGTRVRPGQRSIWARVGYMVETPHAYPDLTVRENLEVIRRLRKIENSNAVRKVIHQLGLTGEAEKRAGYLSLGNSQRLGLAKAFIHRPDLLILDEPANGLDPAGIVEIRNLLRSLAENHGVTIFMSSHILNEVSRLATRVGVLHEGRLVKELSASELKKQEQERLLVDVRNRTAALSVLERAGLKAIPENCNSIVIRDKNAIEHPDRVATLLVNSDCPPVRLIVEHEDLESYFLSLVGQKRTGDNERND